jgi:hypothetical protein
MSGAAVVDRAGGVVRLGVGWERLEEAGPAPANPCGAATPEALGGSGGGVSLRKPEWLLHPAASNAPASSASTLRMRPVIGTSFRRSTVPARSLPIPYHVGGQRGDRAPAEEVAKDTALGSAGFVG